MMIVADLLAVSDSFSLLLSQPPRFFSAAVGFSVWYLLSAAGYQRAVKTLAWLSTLLLAYVVSAALVTTSVTELLKGIVIPHIPSGPAYGIAAIALFGSLLTPDIIVWQTSSRRDAAQAGAPEHGSHSTAGCAVASLVSLSAIIAASSLKVADPTSMTTRAAAEALSSLGQAGPVIFSIGIIGSGLIALPILVASLCFSIAEAVNWKSGLNTPPWQARHFYLLICALLLAAVIVSYTSVNTVRLLYWSQVLAGITVVPLLIVILLLSNNRRVVREKNRTGENFWLGAAIGGMAAANAIFLWTQFIRL
jgi:Mn2+/Fe2+ NRAMP family transporter